MSGRPHSLTACTALVLVVLAASALAVGAQNLPKGTPAPKADSVPILPLSQVRPGMQGVVRTVLSGDKIEELPAEVIAVMDNALGPGYDLILARLTGDRANFTGVAAGMSGSPVYVDGKLMGALSYRIGVFTKEPLAGITPIEYMLHIGEGGSAPPVASATTPASTEGDPASWDGMEVRPIATPLVVSGLAPGVLDRIAPGIEALGLPVAGGGGGSDSLAGSDDGRPVQPGDAIGVQLIRGDIGIAVSGTVTYVDGDRVLAFGHGLLQSGYNEFPMARAKVYAVLASDAGSSKIMEVTDPIGTWEDIRLTGSAGTTSRVPDMIPVKVSVKMPTIDRSFSYEIAKHTDWTPVLAAISIAGSLVNTPSFSNESTLDVKSRIRIDGHPDVVFENLYTGLGASGSAALSSAADMQSIFAAVFQNRFEKPVVRDLEVSAQGVEKGRISFVEGVWPSRTEASPGEDVRYNVRLRSFRGDVQTRAFTFHVPEQAPRGTLRILVGGGSFLASAERGILVRQITGAESLDQIISVVNHLRRGDALYAKALRRLPGAVVQSEVLPALPPSILTTLSTNRGSGEVATMAETTLWEDHVDMDSVIVGGTALALRIR